jgi:hypothetical protein
MELDGVVKKKEQRCAALRQRLVRQKPWRLNWSWPHPSPHL